MNGIGDVGYELFLPRAEDSARVDAAQLGHSPGREDRIPYGTKVLYVSGDDLHIVRLNHELSKGHTSVHSLNGFFDIGARARGGRLADVTVGDGVLVFLLAVVGGFEGGDAKTKQGRLRGGQVLGTSCCCKRINTVTTINTVAFT